MSKEDINYDEIKHSLINANNAVDRVHGQLFWFWIMKAVVHALLRIGDAIQEHR